MMPSPKTVFFSICKVSITSNGPKRVSFFSDLSLSSEGDIRKLLEVETISDDQIIDINSLTPTERWECCQNKRYCEKDSHTFILIKFLACTITHCIKPSRSQICRMSIYKPTPSEIVTQAFVEHCCAAYQMDHNGYHGFDHWMRVLYNGRLLAGMEKANLRILELFCLLHDTQRRQK
tara:strand:- start:140 stop:670 length:531 start_codon:yes stop_codon:yes gene_type:complete